MQKRAGGGSLWSFDGVPTSSTSPQVTQSSERRHIYVILTLFPPPPPLHISLHWTWGALECGAISDMLTSHAVEDEGMMMMEINEPLDKP
jgi:hypothetical protein